MRLSEVKSFLTNREVYHITLPDGTSVPPHFHVTEIGEVTKAFVDCGGTQRREKRASFQLWSADDYDHRLHPEKLLKIISIAECDLGLGDLEVQVEFQGKDTIQLFGLEAAGEELRLTGMATDCLARENCGVPAKGISLNDQIAATACTPGGGCC
ncbi:MAG: DUF6428 family protein [Bacteroidota bacterium]